jgi:hypothetical protein
MTVTARALNAQQVRAGHRRDAMVDIMAEAAREGRVCPSLAELAGVLDCTPETACKDIKALHRAGRITVDGGRHYRQVRVGHHCTAPLVFSNGCGDILAAATADGGNDSAFRRITPAEFDEMMAERGYHFEDSPRACRPVRRITPQPVPARSGGGVSTYGA